MGSPPTKYLLLKCQSVLYFCGLPVQQNGMCTNLKMNVRRSKRRSSVKAKQPIAVIVNVERVSHFLSILYTVHACIGFSWCKCIFCWYFHWSSIHIECLFPSCSFQKTFDSLFYRHIFFRSSLHSSVLFCSKQPNIPNRAYRWVLVRCMCLTKQSSGL